MGYSAEVVRRARDRLAQAREDRASEDRQHLAEAYERVPRIREIDRELPKHVTLDLGGVTFMDSSGIAVVLRCYRRTAELGGAVTVKDVPPQAEKVLRAAGLERLMRFA